MSYATFDVPVTCGALRVGRWSPTDGDATTTVVAVHGITAHHLSWPFLAEALPQAEIVAPDLRGRGRSRDLPPDVGLAAHADDVAAVIRAVRADGGPQRVVLVGHSMGGFVSVVLAARYPELVSGLVLVDGGFPFAAAEQATTQAGLELIKGRLEARFPSADTYVELFRAHPAFARDWTKEVADYARYDVVGDPPECHASAVLEAVVADQHDVMGSTAGQDALEWMAGPQAPRTIFLRAPRGFVDDPPGLYAHDTATDLKERFPAVEFRDVDDVNHYTIVLSARGSEAVAAAVRDVVR